MFFLYIFSDLINDFIVQIELCIVLPANPPFLLLLVYVRNVSSYLVTVVVVE